MEKTVLAIDPGTSKFGMALVRRDAKKRMEPLWRIVAPCSELVSRLEEALAIAPYDLIIVGGGTQSRATVAAVREHLPRVAMLVVDEKDTTMHARERYWLHNRRRGWRRLLPATLQVPPEPVDDFVALILAERVLGQG